MNPMHVAINPCTWAGYVKHTGTTFDWQQFVRDAAAAGYAGIEFGGTPLPPRDARAFVASCGLEICAYGLNVLYDLRWKGAKDYRRGIEYAAELGVKTLMTCGGFMGNNRRTTYAGDYDKFAENLGGAMAYARKLGCEIAFHNHRGCIVETIAETKEMTKRLPALKLCVDIAHLEASGEDALTFITTFHERIIHTHIKDYSWKKDSFIELGKGDGTLDVAATVRALARAGYRGWLCVELDKNWARVPRPAPLQSALQCRRYLRAIGY
jgi:inosose dehydratase